MARIAKDYGYTLAELRELSDGDHMSTTLRAEFFFDDEAQTWHYRVPALHINGGGTATREETPEEPKKPNKHEKEGPEDDKQVPPDKTPSPNEPKPGKHGK